MEYSDVLSSAALGISVLTAGWTGYRTWRWDKPVVVLSGEQWMGGSSETGAELRAGFNVKILNVGNQATQILKAGWQLDNGTGYDFQFTFKGEEGSELPVTLDRYGHLLLDATFSLKGHINPQKFFRGRPFVEYTTRKKTTVTKYGPWEKTQIRAHFKSLWEADEGTHLDS
ncbi:hypothetical protein [Paeniglutamicibacter sp.]|uniref:hypothetical protein n=1 Tax=Paeniglutamicibacter sp. TaxID=1934391 RepID=UPI0039898C8F